MVSLAFYGKELQIRSIVVSSPVQASSEVHSSGSKVDGTFQNRHKALRNGDSQTGIKNVFCCDEIKFRLNNDANKGSLRARKVQFF